jgi:hypothetical protein
LISGSQWKPGASEAVTPGKRWSLDGSQSILWTKSSPLMAVQSFNRYPTKESNADGEEPNEHKQVVHVDRSEEDDDQG